MEKFKYLCGNKGGSSFGSGAPPPGSWWWTSNVSTMWGVRNEKVDAMVDVTFFAPFEKLSLLSHPLQSKFTILLYSELPTLNFEKMVDMVDVYFYRSRQNAPFHLYINIRGFFLRLPSTSTISFLYKPMIDNDRLKHIKNHEEWRWIDDKTRSY